MMGSVCAEQHHKFHHFTKKPEIDIPPRKLIGRRHSPSSSAAVDSPNGEASAVFSRFLPCNNPHSDDDDDDPYSSDHFRIYEFKIRKCNRSRSHDWTDCPFAHPGEKARRRDPRRFLYSGAVCPDFRKGGGCHRGDGCELSHGVFECWLHPSRYRTEACKDGKHCKRKVCFFAHSSRQLRIVPESPPSPPAAERISYCHGGEIAAAGDLDLNFNRNCCVFCRSITASPTSTLIGMSHVSPPASPMFSPVDRRRAGLHEFMSASGLSYEEALTELMASYEAMSVAEAGPVGFRGGVSGGRNLMDDDRYSSSGSGPNSGGPDLGWVNDLLT